MGWMDKMLAIGRVNGSRSIWRGTLKGAKTGILAGVCLAVVYLVIGALADTEFNKSVGFSLLLVGFPTLFAVIPALQWLGVQGGNHEGMALLVLTLSLNGALWGSIIGAAVALWPLVHGNRITPRS
jgi:hypothetical protein